jgi:Ca2+-binding EF-hand superfamily protein
MTMGFLWISSAALLLMQQAVTEPVARAEYLKVMDGEFKKLDADGDGKVIAQEVAATLTRDQRAQVLALNRDIFTQLDKDKNGALSPEEFVGLAAEPPPADPKPFMQRMDLDKNGTVSLVEHRTALLTTFDAIDADKDGVVTPAEMQASQQRPPQPQPSAAKR